jgi:hypothetical protein
VACSFDLRATPHQPRRSDRTACHRLLRGRFRYIICVELRQGLRDDFSERVECPAWIGEARRTAMLRGHMTSIQFLEIPEFIEIESIIHFDQSRYIVFFHDQISPSMHDCYENLYHMLKSFLKPCHS